jgi:hypothetical protein
MQAFGWHNLALAQKVTNIQQDQMRLHSGVGFMRFRAMCCIVLLNSAIDRFGFAIFLFIPKLRSLAYSRQNNQTCRG